MSATAGFPGWESKCDKGLGEAGLGPEWREGGFRAPAAFLQPLKQDACSQSGGWFQQGKLGSLASKPLPLPPELGVGLSHFEMTGNLSFLSACSLSFGLCSSGGLQAQ